MRYLLLGLLALSDWIYAALDFTAVDGADVGIEAVLEAHVAAFSAAQRAAGRRPTDAWLWGSVGWSDASGSYLYFTFHNSKSGFLFQRRADGSYLDVTPASAGELLNPTCETRPTVMDVDNNGLMDLIHTGDESEECASMLHQADGSWAYSRDYRLSWGGVITDVDGDGLLDLQSVRTRRQRQFWGQSFVHTAHNTGTGFRVTVQALELPTELPQAVIDRIRAADDRYHATRLYQLPDGYLVTHGGSYGGEKFNYLIRDGRIVDRGLPREGMALPPLDVDGDGDYDIALQHGPFHGLYRQRSDGSFYLDTRGDMRVVNESLEHGAYADELWAEDFDGDGDNDLLISNRRHGVGFLLENVRGTFRLVRRIEHVDGVAMYVADIDADGDLDITVAGAGDRAGKKRDGKDAMLYINNAGPRATASPRVPGSLPSLITVGVTAAGEEPVPEPVAIRPAPPPPGDARRIRAEEGPEPAQMDRNPRVGRIPLPDHDPGSRAWRDWVAHVKRQGGRANEHALLGAVTGDTAQCATAIALAQAIVDADTVAGNQYLQSGRQFAAVFETMAWCDLPRAQARTWAAWGRGHLGETDGSAGDRGSKIWWKRRWSRNNPANNYYHAFVRATSAYAMATGDRVWIDFLKSDRLPRMYAYYATTPEGGSREGTAYGESHRDVFYLARLWREYDGTEVLPQEFIDGSLRYWVHATAPGSRRLAVIGDQARTKGKADGYHCDILDNALAVASDPQAMALARWQIGQWNCFSSGVFRRLILRDYPRVPFPGAPLEYHAKGAGHFFARDGWGPDATFMWFLAGIRDEAHQCEDQGGFGIWAAGEYQTTGDAVWTRKGLCAGGRGTVATQNVMRFPDLPKNIRRQAGKLRYVVDGDELIVDMDLSRVVGREWTRRALWKRGSRRLRIIDSFDGEGSFGFEKPSADDQRAPYYSGARADVRRTATGMDTTIHFASP